MSSDVIGDCASVSQREATGLTGDQAESNGASSGRTDLTVSVSPEACHARPSVIATKNVYLVFLACFWEVTKAAGLTGTGQKTRGLALTDPTCQ